MGAGDDEQHTSPGRPAAGDGQQPGVPGATPLDGEPERERQSAGGAASSGDEDPADTGSEDSFPASDPPANSGTT